MTRQDMESRRMQAAALFANGVRQAEVSRTLYVSRTTASRWNRDWKAGGIKRLFLRRASGRPCRVSRDRIVVFIREQGLTTAPYKQIAYAIASSFGVHYCTDHVGRILNGLGMRRNGKHGVVVLAAAGGAN